MIFDQLGRAGRADPRLAAAFAFLAGRDFSADPPGRIELQGDALYALVQEYTTKPAEAGQWEAHRRYIDVQYLVRGCERIGFAPVETLQAGAYIPEKDFLPLSGPGSSLDLSAGYFAVFYPEDAHMPGLAVKGPESVKKVVVKVRVD